MINKEIIYNISAGAGAASGFALIGLSIADLLMGKNTGSWLGASSLAFSASNVGLAASAGTRVERLNHTLTAAFTGCLGAMHLVPAENINGRFALAVPGLVMILARFAVPPVAKTIIADKIADTADAVRRAIFNNNNMMLR